MTAATVRKPATKGVQGLIYTGVYIGALVLLFIGERLVLESTAIRLGLAALAAVGIAVAVAGRVVRGRKMPAPARAVEKKLMLLYLLGVVALLVYAGQADFMMDRLRPLFDEARSADRYQGALLALWPVLLTLSVLPLVFVELSYAQMDVHRTLEPALIGRSLRAGLLVSLTLTLLMVGNYIVSEYDEKVDLSYFKTTRPSESSRKMVQNLSEKVEAVLFYPGANEVQERVESYFASLASASKHFTVRTVDHVLEPGLAKEMSVSDNGTVVLARGSQHQTISVGTKLRRAKSKLRRLDGEFQKAFTKLMQKQRVAYLTVGHDERTTRPRGGVRGTGIRDARTVLERLNYTIKELGVGQGLGDQVPDDASVVIVAGPQKPFLPAEEAALKRYLEQGGRAMIYLDAESEVELAGVLGPFGLEFTPERLANDKFMVRVTHTRADRYALYSNRFSSHPSVSTLSRNSHRVVTVMLGAGSLSQTPPAKGLKSQVQFSVHSMPFTWNDVNNNMVFDSDGEKRKVYELGAVVAMKLAGGAKEDGKDKGKAGDGDDELRMIVMADSDMLTDRLFRNPGNGYHFIDGLKWLVGQEEYIGETTSEEDVRIVHTRKEDVLWFYLTIFAVPALVLGVGLLITLTRRKR